MVDCRAVSMLDNIHIMENIHFHQHSEVIVSRETESGEGGMQDKWLKMFRRINKKVFSQPSTLLF